MARSRSTLALVSLAFAALLLASTPAQAQGEAACAWLKIKVAGKGFEIDEAGTALGPARSPKAICYAQLVFVAPSGEHPNGRYTAPLVCLHGANEAWEMTDADNGMAIDLLADGNGVSDDDYMTFHGENGDVVQGYASHVLRVVLDKEGVFKKATWKTLGAQMMDGSTYFRTPSLVFGGYTATGATVPAEKVPEGARALMSSGMCPAIPAAL